MNNAATRLKGRETRHRRIRKKKFLELLRVLD